MNISFKKDLPWVVCLASSTYLFLVYLQMLLPNTIGEELIQRFHLTAGELSLYSSSYFIANTLGIIPAAILVDRGSTRFYTILGMSLMAIGSFSLAFPVSLNILFIGRILSGIGSAFIVCCIKLVSRWFPMERVASVMGVMNAMTMMGGIIAQAPTTYFISQYGFYAVMQGYAFLASLFLLAVILTVHNHPSNRPDPVVSKTTSPLRQLAIIYKSTQNWLAAFYSGLMVQPTVLLGGLWGVMYITQTHHLSKLTAANYTLLIFLGSFIGNPIIGWCSDAIDSRRIPMFLCGMLAITALLLMVYTPPLHSNWVLPLMFFLLGFASSGQMLSYPLVTANNPPELTATANSAVSVGIIGLGAFTQPLFTWLMEYHWVPAWENGIPIFSKSNYELAFSLLIIAVIIATGLIFFIKKQKV